MFHSDYKLLKLRSGNDLQIKQKKKLNISTSTLMGNTMTLYQLMQQQRYHKIPNDYKTSYGHLHLIDELLSMYCTRPVGLLGPFFMEVRDPR